MSQRLKRAVIVAAILAIAVVFIYEFRPGRMGQQAGGAGTACVIEVAGSCVDRNEFQSSLRLTIPSGADEDFVEKNRLRHQVTQGFVERELLIKEAERLGISVSDDDITAELRRGFVHVSLPVAWEMDVNDKGEDQGAISGLYLNVTSTRAPRFDYQYSGPARQIEMFTDPKKGVFDYGRYERWVRQSSGKTPGDFRESQRRELIAARMRALIQSRVQVSEAEVFEVYARANERIVIDYAKLDNPLYIAWAVDQADGALAAWMEKSSAEVDKAWEGNKAKFGDECRMTRILVLDWDRTVDGADALKEKQKGELTALRARIVEAKEPGREFTSAVRERSEEFESRARDGLVGCVPKTEDSLATTAFALKAPGDVSDIIETPFGLAIVRLESILKGDDLTREGKRTVGRDLYLGAEAERLSNEASKQIITSVKGGTDLKAAIDTYLDGVLATVETRLAERAKRDAEKKDGDKKDPDKLASDVRFGTPDVERWLKAARADKRKPRPLTSSAFAQGEPAFSGVPALATPGLFKLDKPGAFAEEPLKLAGDNRTGGYAVAVLKERQPVNMEEWDKERPRALDIVRRQKQRDALASYVQRLRKAYAGKVKTDPSLKVAPKETESEDG